MTKTKKPEPDDKEQSARFFETAKALESDESGKAFERALKIIHAPKREVVPSRPSSKRSSP